MSRRQPRAAPVLLLIEDDRDTLVAAGRVLERCGFAVEIGRGGDDGIAKAISRRPDIVVTDVLMPRTSGVEVCERLHRDVKTRHIPVIAYTGLTEVPALARLVKYGVRVFAIKPCLPTVIAAEAHALLVPGQHDQDAIRVVSGEGEELEHFAQEIQAALLDANRSNG
jgi:response regulator RpfG family c-di-GMP phosphodiesterase